MVYNTISTRHVLTKILRDLDIQEENTRLTDFIEWIGEGLTKIGAVKALKTKVTGKDTIPLLELTDYQVALPSDLFKILGVAYSSSEDGVFTPLRYGTGTYDSSGGEATASSGDITLPTTDIIDLTMDIYDLSYSEALELLTTDPITAQKMSMLLIEDKLPTVQQQTNPTLDYTYVVNSSYIKTNIKDGYIMLAYAAMETDDDGYPIIPDDPSFSEALYWYVVMKYMYPKWLLGTVRDLQYFEARRSWNFYRKQAYAVAMMPNADGLESLKNQSLKLYPEVGEFNNFFSTAGEQQVLFNHNLR